MKGKGSFTKEDAKKKNEQLVEELKGLISEVTPDDILKFSRSWIAGKMTFPGLKSYSLHNYIIAMLQMKRRGLEGITFIAPYSTWKEKGRQVKKGQKALKILAPMISKYWVDEVGKYHWISRKNPAPKGVEIKTMLTGFQLVPVFDFSQTEGDEIKDFEVVKGGLQGVWSEGESKYSLDHVLSVSGITVNFYDVSRKGEEGYTNGSVVGLLDHRDEPGKEQDMISTFVHEWAHFKLHFDEQGSKVPGAVKEVEAETVAFVVCSLLGFKSLQAPIYIKGWEKKTKDTKPRIDKVLKVVESISNSIFLSEEKSESIQKSA